MKHTLGLLAAPLFLAFWLLAPDTQLETGIENPTVGALEIPNVTIERKEAAVQNGVLFYKDALFSGRVLKPATDSRLKSVAEYFEGKKHGISESWYPNGTRAEIRYYRAGRKTGVHTGWWPSGNLKSSYSFSDGKYHGDFREWYDNGQPATAFYYEDGQEVGPQKGWRENGKLYINLIYKDGKRYGVLRSKPCFQIVDGQRNSVEDPDEVF